MLRALRWVTDAVTRGVVGTVGLLHPVGSLVPWPRHSPVRTREVVRRHALRTTGMLFDARAGPRPITEGEYAGTLPASRAETERLLRARGLVRNPLSRVKSRGDQLEVGSWVYRDSPLAARQVHLMLFPGDDGIDVYAHEEPSSGNPVTAVSHFVGDRQNVALGVAHARATLPLETDDASVTPVAGPWTDQPR